MVKNKKLPYISERTFKYVMFNGDREDIPALLHEAADWLKTNGFGPPDYSLIVYDIKLVQNDEYDTASVVIELNV